MSTPTARAASKTARMVAAYRGRATDGHPAICKDPWAKALAGDDGFSIAEATDRLYPHMELWIAMRTLYLDTAVQTFADQGIHQIVILGAGLDTRAARLQRENCQYFLVDHPASQADRRARLETIQGYPQQAEIEVPCDFERDDFIEKLTHCGFDTTQPALILWKGVVYYLHESAARQTLHGIASQLHPESVLLFDYLSRRLVEARGTLHNEGALVEQLAHLGEPLRFGINDPTPLLYESGFRHIRTISFDEIALSATGTYERERLFRFQHVATASVERCLLP